MRNTLFIIILLCICVPAGAQTSHRDSVLTQARYLKSIYKTDDAIEALVSIMSPDCFDEGVMAELADCHFQNGNYDDAADTYTLLTSLVPSNILYKVKLMQTAYRQKAYPQSIQAGRAVLQMDSIPAVYSIVGDSFLQMEQGDSALWYYRKSLSMKPFNETVVSKAFNILVNSEDYDGAIAVCEPVLAEDPDNMKIAPLKGVALFRKGDYDSAIDIFQRQEDIGNDIYPIHYYLGQSYWLTKVIYRAEQELVAAWQIDSSDVNLAYSIAAVKLEAFRPFERDVKPWLDKAWDMIQPDPVLMSRLHQQYGQGYYTQLEKWDEAIAHYKEAYRYNPKHYSILSTIGYCYERKKDYNQALEWYEKYMKFARPGSKGYEFAAQSIEYLKGEFFMEEQ